MLSGVQRLLALSEQQLSLVSHNPVNPLMVNLATVDLQPVPDSPVAIGGSVLDHASKASFRSASSALGGGFLISDHSVERVFLVNTLLRDTPRAMNTALIARPRAIQASAQSTFLL
jgi:hypothetical protein